jgi:chromosome segregation and condensation protein ScpB
MASEAAATLSVQRNCRAPRPRSHAQLRVGALRRLVTRVGIEHIRGSSSDNVLDTLLVHGLVEFDQHHLLVTTRAFLDFAGLRDLADLPPLQDLSTSDQSDDASLTSVS